MLMILFSLQQSWPVAFYDSVLVYGNALHQLLEVDGYNLTQSTFDCLQVPAQPWRDGDKVFQAMLDVS